MYIRNLVHSFWNLSNSNRATYIQYGIDEVLLLHGCAYPIHSIYYDTINRSHTHTHGRRIIFKENRKILIVRCHSIKWIWRLLRLVRVVGRRLFCWWKRKFEIKQLLSHHSKKCQISKTNSVSRKTDLKKMINE